MAIDKFLLWQKILFIFTGSINNYTTSKINYTTSINNYTTSKINYTTSKNI